jgi:hypothetical protein
VFAGPVTASSTGYLLSPSDVGFVGTNNDGFGTSTLAADADGDGFADLLVGAVGTVSRGFASAGGVYLFSGTRTALRAERAVFQGDVGGTDGAGDNFGGALAVGDFDKDGRADAILGAHGKTRSGAARTGAAYVLDDLSPATARAVEQYAPMDGLQSAPVSTGTAPVRYAYGDNVGGPRILTQTIPTSPNSVQRVADGPPEGVLTGRPAIGQASDGKGVVAFRSTTGDVWIRTEVTAGSPGWGPWVNYGGADLSGIAMSNAPGGRLVVFGVSARGELTVLRESSDVSARDKFSAWQGLGIGNLTGDPVTLSTPDGVRIFTTDADGDVMTALWTEAALTGCARIGDRAIVGRPAMVVYPGSRLRLFATTADQQLITIGQDTAGNFERSWTTVQANGVEGSPAAIFNRNTARITVLARGTDRRIWTTTETAQGSNQYRTWEQVSDDEAYTDVIAVPYVVSTGSGVNVLYRDIDNREFFVTVRDTAALAARGQAPKFGVKGPDDKALT